MNSLAYSHCKFESIIVHLVFNIILYLVLPVNCGEHLLILYYSIWIVGEPVHDKSDV